VNTSSTSLQFTEFQNVDSLQALCEGIDIARRVKDFPTEEQLYRRLIKIYRTPMDLIALGRRKDGTAYESDARLVSTSGKAKEE
jgi:hypothetical protein